MERGPAAALAPLGRSRSSELHAEGKVTVFPGIGYASPDQSHFTSRHYWEVGELDTHANTGWLGRLLDGIGTTDNPLQGVSLDGYLSPSLATARIPVAATWGANYDLWAPGVWGDVEELMFETFGRIGAKHERGSDRGLQTAGRATRQAEQLREKLKPFGELEGSGAYPDTGHFPESLAGLAAMLVGGPADPLRRAQRARRLRHPRQPGGRLRQLPRRRPATRSSPSSATSRRAASPTGW